MNVWAMLLAPALLAAAEPHPPRLTLPTLAQAPSMARDADLSTWKGALEVREFGMIMPDDKGANRWPTVAHFAWGPDALYAAFECFDPEPGQVRAYRHKRDDFNGDPDFVGLDIDATGQGRTCMRLLVTPLGGQFDGLYTENVSEDYTYNCLWDSVGVLTPGGYVVKLRLPYASLRRAPGDWSLRVLRIIPRERRYGIAWPAMSKDITCDLCQMARVGGAPVAKSGSPFLVIPFVSGQREQDRLADPAAPVSTSGRLGLDLRYSAPAVTLEGTYRPDFSNVDADVDPLQINSRFKVYFPEHRPFFLEGMEMLGTQGAQRQFFSRSVQDPQYGLKASGSSALATWTALTAKDLAGGSILDANSANGGAAGLPTRDTAAAVSFKLDGKSSNLAILATDKLLLGGPAGSGGRSGGIYLNQFLGAGFRFIGSVMEAQSRLPQAGGAPLAQRGSASSGELDWNDRNWYASAVSQATSPDLVLVSGFTDLQGYRRRTANAGWHGQWNEGALARANFQLTARDLTFWDGSSMDRGAGYDAYVETPGRLGFELYGDVGGRTWANDRVTSHAIASTNLNFSWSRLTRFQPWLNAGVARTLDLDTGVPARFRLLSLGAKGNVDGLAYNVYGQQSDLAAQDDGRLLVRARELVGSFTWQLPLLIYVRTQCYIVRYSGAEAGSSDRFLKAFVGWQPNAFTQAYLGWSGQRTRDPSSGIDPERTVQRGIFAKFAYAFPF